MSDRFSNLQVVVTGGTGALGRAIVSRLLAEGATCHVPSRRSPPAETPWGPDARAHIHGPVSLTDADQVAAFYDALPSVWASIHVAGGFHMGPLSEMGADTFRGQLELNLVSAFLCLREASRRMGQAGGRVVNVISRPALHPAGGMLAYSTAKAGLASMTQCASEELRSGGIFVNAIAPSIIDTPNNRKSMPDADYSQWPKPEELAATVAFLASPENAVTSGALVPTFGRH